MRYIPLFFVILFTGSGIIHGQSDIHTNLAVDISEKIPASSFNKTPITFLFSPSFEPYSDLMPAWTDSLYSRNDLIANRIESDYLNFTLQNNSLNRKTGINFQGHFFGLELDSQLIANDLIVHFMNRQDDGSFNFEMLFDNTDLKGSELSEKKLEQAMALLLNQHFLFVFDIKEYGNNRKRLIAHLYNLAFEDATAGYFFEHHWISPEDSDSTKKSRQLYFKLSPYTLNWIDSYSITCKGKLRIEDFKEVISKADEKVKGIPQYATIKTTDPVISEFGSHSKLHTGQKFTVYNTEYKVRKMQTDKIPRLGLEKEGEVFVKNIRKKEGSQQVRFYQKGKVQSDPSKLLAASRGAGIGVYLGYEAGFQKVNEDQSIFAFKNGGVPVVGIEADLSKYISKGLGINMPHSIHLFTEFNHGLYFNTTYRYQVAEYISSVNGSDVTLNYNHLVYEGFREILEVQTRGIRVGLSKDFCISPTWYLTPYAGMGFYKIFPPKWSGFIPKSDNFPYSPTQRKNKFYELYVGNPLEFSDNDYIIYYHNLDDGLATQRHYFLGMRISAALHSNFHVTGYFEARKRETQLETEAEFFMPDIFILDEFGTRMGLTVKYVF